MPSTGSQQRFIDTGSAAAPVRWRLCDLAPEALPTVATSRLPLLALHGFSGCAADFRWLAAASAATVHCYGLDFLGHGGSDAPASPLPYTAANAVRAIRGALGEINALSPPPTAAATTGSGSATAVTAATAANTAQKATTPQQTPKRQLPVLLGYSMGGRMALRYLAAHGCGGIRALVLIGASAGLASAAERRQRRAADHALARRIETEGVAAFTAHWNQVPLIASQRRSPYFAALQQSRSTNCARGLANSLRGSGTGAVAPVHTRLAAMDVPCLLVTGGQDTKFTGLAANLADALPQAQHLCIPDAGHSPHWEAPAAFTAALFQWLRLLP